MWIWCSLFTVTHVSLWKFISQGYISFRLENFYSGIICFLEFPFFFRNINEWRVQKLHFFTSHRFFSLYIFLPIKVVQFVLLMLLDVFRHKSSFLFRTFYFSGTTFFFIRPFCSLGILLRFSCLFVHHVSIGLILAIRCRFKDQVSVLYVLCACLVLNQRHIYFNVVRWLFFHGLGSLEFWLSIGCASRKPKKKKGSQQADAVWAALLYSWILILVFFCLFSMIILFWESTLSSFVFFHSNKISSSENNGITLWC